MPIIVQALMPAELANLPQSPVNEHKGAPTPQGCDKQQRSNVTKVKAIHEF
jgi:hypothetical protein